MAFINTSDNNRNLSDDGFERTNPVLSSSHPMDSGLGPESSNSWPDVETNHLESVINNYNRICSQLPQNCYNDWLKSFYDLMRSEWTRLRTFHARPNSQWSVTYVSPEELANAGFFYLNGDRVQCAFCRGIVSGWERGDRPLAEHARHFPRCPFIMEEDVRNNPIGVDPIRGPKQRIGHDVCGNMAPTQMHPVLNSISVSNANALPLDMREYGVQPHRGPKNPSFKSIDSRRRSFPANGWDNSVPVSTETLAEAGFFSIGMSDYVKCFYCDGGLCNWELGDDPWVEHAKWFPECQFVRLNKSHSFVDECKRLAESETEKQSNSAANSESDPEIYSTSGSDSEEENIDELGIRAVNEWMSTDIVLQLIDLNTFSVDVIKAVLNRRWFEERHPFHFFAQLYDAVSQSSTPSQYRNSQPVPVISREPDRSLESYSSGSDEECHSGGELPNSQSSISSTTSTLSTISSELNCLEAMSSSESNKSEDNRLLCKICLDREIGVVFLPCGHQLACTQCAPCVTDCPICRKVIRGTVRTFFS